MKPQTRVVLGWKNPGGPVMKFVKEDDETGKFDSVDDVFEATDYESLDGAREAVGSEVFPNAYVIYDLTLTPTLRKVSDDEE